jgi:hypothetical protein
MMPEKMLKYFPLVKVVENDPTTGGHMVYGLVTAEVEDSDGEVCVYEDAKKSYQAWSAQCLKSTTAAGQEPSLGNIRVMHQLQIGGKAVKIDYDDANKQILLGAEPADENIWELCRKGMLRGFSQGGNYAWRDPESAKPRRYAPEIGEVSLVDNPALKIATFSYVKADGSAELRKFQKFDALDTWLEKARALLGEFRSEPTRGETMNPEQLKKTAAALGISEEELGKMLAGNLDKAKKGIAALHAHLQKAIAHHEKMHKKHGELSEQHEEHAEILSKCAGMCKDIMGDGGEKDAEKAAKAAADELAKKAAEEAAAKRAAETTEGFVKAADVEKLIAAGIEKAEKAKAAGDNADQIHIVGRTDGTPPLGKAASASDGSDPYGGAAA